MNTILVADDSRTFREPFAESLRIMGYHVIVAENGRDAIAALQEQLVDLAIIDVCMPELDGVEVLQKMRAENLLEEVPVIVLTSLPKSELPGIEQLGDCSYLHKSDFSFTQLSIEVDRALQRIRSRGASFTAARSATSSRRARAAGQ